jgi:hypothetical protein
MRQRCRALTLLAGRGAVGGSGLHGSRDFLADRTGSPWCREDVGRNGATTLAEPTGPL